jgi:hypothetical protein
MTSSRSALVAVLGLVFADHLTIRKPKSADAER